MRRQKRKSTGCRTERRHPRRYMSTGRESSFRNSHDFPSVLVLTSHDTAVNTRAHSSPRERSWLPMRPGTIGMMVIFPRDLRGWSHIDTWHDSYSARDLSFALPMRCCSGIDMWQGLHRSTTMSMMIIDGIRDSCNRGPND